MTQDEIIEMAIQGHAGTRDAIRWAMKQEREACAKLVDPTEEHRKEAQHYIGGEEGVELLDSRAADIRARGQA